jgi:MerR family transcriptional regulator/heat shock protein HspR
VAPRFTPANLEALMGGFAFDDEAAPLYTVGQVADMLGVQQAFLRRLDTHDIVTPARPSGQQRRYSRADVHLVQHVLDLVNDGLTLAGIHRILALQQQVRDLEDELLALRNAE